MGLFRSAATVSAFTLLSRITGLIRDILVASTFGAGPLTDAFWVAFRIPNLLRRLFAEGAFAQAFVPIIGQARSTESHERVQQILDRVALLLTVALMLVTLGGIVLAPWVVGAMATGMLKASNKEGFDAAVWMTRMMFPYILCMSLVAFASGILNTWRNFVVPAFTPVLLNVCMIIACIWLTPYFSEPIYALSAGVMAGGASQLAVQWAALVKIGLAPKISKNLRSAWSDSTVQFLMRQMMPAIIGVSVAQISILINTNIATWLQSGSVTWLSFADRLMEFPTALLGVALGTVLLPNLSSAFAQGKANEYSSLMDWGLKLTVILGLPAAAGMAALSDGLVATLFNYGAFNQSDVAQTKLAVMSYAVGLPGILAVKILAPGFYARKNIKTPVKIAVIVLITTQLLNLLLVPYLGHAGLALSIGIGGCINAVALLFLLRKQKIYQPSYDWVIFIIKVIIPVAAMTSSVLYINNYIDWIALADHPAKRAFTLFTVVGLAVTIYAISLYIAGFRLRHFTQRSF